MSDAKNLGWTLVDLDAVPPQPWRNGAGLTRELAAWPNAQDWAWRISVAEVSASGPFSHWPGVQRWFAVLGGKGLSLDVDGIRHALDTHSAPLCFDGAAATACTLRDGPTQDLNLMLRQGRAGARMRRVTGAYSATWTQAVTLAIYAVDAEARIELDGKALRLPPRCLAWRRLDAPARIDLAAQHALWMEIEA